MRSYRKTGLIEPIDYLLEVVLEIWKKVEPRHLEISIVTSNRHGAQHVSAC